jgi:hypothetical protein
MELEDHSSPIVNDTDRKKWKVGKTKGIRSITKNTKNK